MIIPTVLENSFELVQKRIKEVDSVAKLIQVDVSDGVLLNDITFSAVYRLDEIDTKSEIEMHLMVKDPMPYLKKKIAKVTRVCSQIESDIKQDEFISKAKSLGYKVGLSINAETPLEELHRFAYKIDFVQFMTVTPGKQGNAFIPSVLGRIRAFRAKYPQLEIQTDGAGNKTTLPHILKSGANNVVIGSAIFSSPNPIKAFKELSTLPMDTNKVSTITNTQNKPIKVGILGGAAWKEDDQVYKDTFEVSRLLALNGYTIVNGGGPGVMRASTQGAHAGGGKALAITYHPNKPKRHYEGVDLENGFDEEIITLDYFDRTKVLLQNTDIHIVFQGSLGTLSEFSMTWINSWIHEPNNKPIILFGEQWSEFIQVFSKVMICQKAEIDLLKICTSPEQVLDIVKNIKA